MAKIRQISLLLALVALGACGDGSMVKKNDLIQLQEVAGKAYAEGDWRAAEKYFRILTERVPGEGEFWFRLGNIYARMHRPDEAIIAYKEALLRQNTKSKAWHNMGIVYLRQSAHAFTQMLTDMNPQDPLFQRAMVLNDAVLKILNDIDTPAGQVDTEPLAPPDKIE
jgi:tetratricopeptide (TPR) repeat protein